MSVTVIGLGAMGGGMARALLASPDITQVIGFDMNEEAMTSFYKEAQECGKAPSAIPSSQKEAITKDTKFVIVALVNESQCEQVCFGGETALLTLMPKESCVFVASTVTATWVRGANQRFREAGIYYVDSPMSGGPARAKEGTLTFMVSGDEDSLSMGKAILDIMGKEIHIIAGGAGMGSTVKMAHQLLAGVHICAAAEALTLASKAGLDPEQFYKIVNGAAGASWMFRDRGERMLLEEQNVKSALNIFIKDLDIVYAEAKAVGSPIPLASSALQQFISGRSMGLGRKDDSQVVKVYESISGTRVSSKKEGINVGDFWKVNGRMEEIMEVGEEPRHKVVIDNEYVRALRVSFPPNDTTLAHRHAEDSLYFFLVEGGLDVVNHVQGRDPACDCMEFGEIRFGTHKSDQPLVHRITNKTSKQMLCIDAEVLQQPPVTAAIPLVAEKHELIKTRDKVRVYKCILEAGESVTVSYPFFHFVVVLQGGKIKTELQTSNGLGVQWSKEFVIGDVDWKEPCCDVKQTNVGTTTFVMFIAEWR